MRLALRDKISIASIIVCIITVSIIISVRCSRGSMVNFNDPQNSIPESRSEYLYGICIDSLNVTSYTVESGQTISTILSKYGVSANNIAAIVEKAKGVFDLRTVKQGNTYQVFTTMDTLQELKYCVYERSAREYVVMSLDSIINVSKGEKEVVIERKSGEAVIESSLWNAATQAGLTGAIAMNLSDVYEWSIDFYAIQKGDSFKVIYDELFVDGKSIGVGNIWGAWFDHAGKRFYAIRHEYTNDKGVAESGYYDIDGKSLRSAFLKAPLKFSRISSRFTSSRLHPVLRIRRPHFGVDYAAPKGTPVRAIGDGTVIMKQYSGGGGNTVKIRHSRGYMSGYLHLSGYGKGVRVGGAVKQGDIIGYVGSTGVSTGPHLDFRIWKNNTPIDPLKISDVKGEDINSKYRAGFEVTKKNIIAELKGEKIPVADSLSVDSISSVNKEVK